MCLKTRYYTNLCVHCYGDIIFWRRMQPWMFLRFREVDGERDARGRWHQSGQGLRRGILLGLRETAKSIAAGPELAFGSDSRPCRNNAVSRSPSSNHPSSAAARPDATFLRRPSIHPPHETTKASHNKSTPETIPPSSDIPFPPPHPKAQSNKKKNATPRQRPQNITSRSPDVSGSYKTTHSP